MATFLDTTFIEQSSIVFKWLLIFVVMFGVAEATQLLKNRALHAILALAVSIVAVSSNTVQQTLNSLTPWFVVMGFFLFFLLILTRFMGIDTTQVVQSLGGNNATWFILVPFIIVLLIGLSSALGQSLLEERTGPTPTTTVVDADGNVQTIETPHQESVIFTITDPKVLGFILIMLIGVFTITFLAGKPPGLA